MIQHHLDKSLLPPPRSFFERELGRLSRADRKGWCKCNCPFHQSKSKKSFNVNLQHGGWVCFGCGMRGGDLVSFVMQRDRVPFRRACERLGAWRDVSTADRERIAREQRDREQKRLDADERAAEEKRNRIAARDLLHSLERTQDKVSRELARLERESPGVESKVKDQLLISLVMLCDQVRDAESDYRLLAGLAQP
jgi:DNA primase